MIRFGLLQFRAQAIVALAVLAAVAVTLLVTGAHLSYLYDSSGVAGCAPHGAGKDNCAALTSALLIRVRGYAPFGAIYWASLYAVYLVPAVVGMFWGAPLITREIDAGTLRLAWTQGVTRTRWLAVKLGLVGLAGMAAAGLLSLMVTWWAGRVDALEPFGMNRLQPAMFGTRGIVPAGYAAFAFVLGVTAGLLIRNTVGAIAATPAIMAAVEAAVILWVRPYLISPVRAVSPLNLAAIGAEGTNAGAPLSNQLFVQAEGNPPGGWVYSSQVLSASGRTSLGPQPHACVPGTGQACLDALGKLHLQQVVTYQPASRFWPLQWAETGVFVALALLLAGFCFWWIRRRLPG